MNGGVRLYTTIHHKRIDRDEGRCLTLHYTAIHHKKMTCMNVAWAMFWGGSRSTKPCVFPCKVAAAGDERYLVCVAVAAAVVLVPLCSATSGCSCVRSSMRFLNLWLQIALEWLLIVVI